MLQDGVTLSPGSKAVGLAVESGTAFPASPVDGQRFRLTTTVGAYTPDEYWYDAATTTWVSGDISAVVAGTGLSGGGTRGSVSLAIDPQWLDLHSLPRAGGAVSGQIELPHDPQLALEAATKQYVDAVTAALNNLVTSLQGYLLKTGGTMSGPLSVQTPTAASHAVPKSVVDALQQYVNGLVQKAGDTMTGALLLHADPTQALEAATKQYVDALGAKYQDLLVTLSQPGTLTVLTGTARWYPPKNIKILDIQAFLGVPCTGTPVHLNVLKNGAALLGAPVEVPINSNYSNAYMVADPVNLMSVADYLTLDVTQIGSAVTGSDLMVRIRYNYV